MPAVVPIWGLIGTNWFASSAMLPPLASGPWWPWLPVLLGLQLLPGGALVRALAQGSSTRSLPA